MNAQSFEHLLVDSRGPVAVVSLNRPGKRNAVNDALLAEIEAVFDSPPDGTKVVVIEGKGQHFCAGLDLSEHRVRTAVDVLGHSRWWHRVFDKIENGALPVVAALHGAVVGGGLELAAASHIRVADETAFYALPEGQRGIYVGGGASVRLARLIGAARMADMMLTGASYPAAEGNLLGFSQHLVPAGGALEKALALAERIASNAPLTNYAILQALPRIQDMSRSDGLFVESLMAALVQTSPDAEERMRAFVEGRAEKVGRGN